MVHRKEKQLVISPFSQDTPAVSLPAFRPFLHPFVPLGLTNQPMQNTPTWARRTIPINPPHLTSTLLSSYNRHRQGKTLSKSRATSYLSTFSPGNGK